MLQQLLTQCVTPPLDFGYLWPGHANGDTTNTVAITHKATNTVARYHPFMLKWLREYCAYWGRHFVGHDETSFIDTLASLDVSATQFETLGRMIYGARASQDEGSNVGDGRLALPAALEGEHFNKRARWLRLMCERVVVPGVAYTKSMHRLLQNDEWIQCMQTRVCKNIEKGLFAVDFFEALAKRASSSKVDNNDTSSSSLFNDEWFFELNGDAQFAACQSNKDSQKKEDDTSTKDDWTQLGRALGVIAFDLFGDHKEAQDGIVENDAWHQYRVSLFAILFQAINRHVSRLFGVQSTLSTSCMRVQQAIYDGLYETTQPYMSTGQLWSISLLMTNTTIDNMMFHVIGMPIKNTSPMGWTQWRTAMSSCMAHYGSLHIFGASAAALAQAELANAKNLGTPRFEIVEILQAPTPPKKRLQLSMPDANFTVSIESKDDKKPITFAVHDFMLAQWAYFQRLMSAGMVEMRERHMTLPADFSPTVLRIILGTIYGVDLNNTIATNGNTLTEVKTETMRFILNECITMYDMATVAPEDEVCSTEATSSSAPTVTTALIQRLKREDADKAAAVCLAAQQNASGDIPPLEALEKFTSHLPTIENPMQFLQYAVKINKHTTIFAPRTPPNLLKRKVENAPRLANAFVSLLDVLVATIHRRDQINAINLHVRVADRDAASDRNAVGLMPSMTDVGTAAMSLIGNMNKVLLGQRPDGDTFSAVPPVLPTYNNTHPPPPLVLQRLIPRLPDELPTTTPNSESDEEYI